MNRIAIAALSAAALIAASGCATLDLGDGLDKAQAVVDVATLEREFEEARDALLSLDLTAPEKRIVSEHIASLQRVKEGALRFGDVAATLVTPERANALLDEVAASTNGIRAIYGGYLTRTGESADPNLTRYFNAGVRVWRMLKAAANADQGVRAGDIRGLVVYLARGYLLVKSGRVAGIPI